MGGETSTACSTPPKKQMANQLGILNYVSPSPIVSANNSQFTSFLAPLAVLVHDPAERSTFKTTATMLAVYELLMDPTFKAQQQSSDRLLDRDFAGCFAVYHPRYYTCSSADNAHALVKVATSRPTADMLCQGYKEKEEEKEKKKKKKKKKKEEEEEEEEGEEEEEEEES
nr:unnamed protein product [Spirometra erinaceieuropaei]